MAIKTVTQSRERRATAGKRMSSLVGKAQEDDEAFWNHDTWGDEHDEDYDIGEEKKEDIVDVFDSDFNDSEDESSAGEDEDESNVESKKRKRTSAGTGLSKKQSSRRKRQATTPSQGGKKPQLTEDLSPTSRLVLTTIDPVLYPALYQRQQLLISQAKIRVSEAQKRDAESNAPVRSARSLMLKKKSKEKQKRSTFGTGLNAGMTLHVPSSANELQRSLDEWKQLAKDFEEAVAKREHQERQNLEDEASFEKADDQSKNGKIESSQQSHTIKQNGEEHSSRIEAKLGASSSDITKSTPLTSNLKIDVAERMSLSANDPVSKSRSLRTTTVQQSHATAAAAKQESTLSKESVTGGKIGGPPPRSDRKHIPTQEEMLMEAVHVTELENKKWLHTRQRQAAQDNSNSAGFTTKGVLNNSFIGGLRAHERKKLVEKRHSKRGCFNTITFPDLDHIPFEWKAVMGIHRKRHAPSTTAKHGSSTTSVASSVDFNEKVSPKCYVTKQPASYRDPKTGLFYANVEAYKEIQRQFNAGLLPPATIPSSAKNEISKGRTTTFPSSKAAQLSAASFKTLKVFVAGTYVTPPIAVKNGSTKNLKTGTTTSFERRSAPTHTLPETAVEGMKSQSTSALTPLETANVGEAPEHLGGTVSSKTPSCVVSSTNNDGKSSAPRLTL